MELEVFTADAFTDKSFRGNPAAVCIVREEYARHIDDAKMQAIASEMNLSETAFVTEEEGSTFENGTAFCLRWFTPKCEVSLCGHATLATAAVLFKALGNPNKEVRFKTRSGLLKAVRCAELITLDFPLASCSPADPRNLEELIKATVGNLPVLDAHYSVSTKKLLLRLDDEVGSKGLQDLNPKFTKMVHVQQQRIKGIIVTIKGAGDYDFLSRYFAPWVGIPEDPVTGSAHTVLASYWSEKLGKREMLAHQCSQRGGELKVTVGEGGRVYLAGKACIVLQGKFLDL